MNNEIKFCFDDKIYLLKKNQIEEKRVKELLYSAFFTESLLLSGFIELEKDFLRSLHSYVSSLKYYLSLLNKGNIEPERKIKQSLSQSHKIVFTRVTYIVVFKTISYI